MTMFQNLHRIMRPADRLKIACEQCGHAVEWSRAQAFKALGPDAAPYDIRRRLRCSACGDGANVTVRI